MNLIRRLTCGFALLVLAAGPSVAQQERDLIEVIRAQIATNRQALVAENLGLDEAQSQAFWPVYRKYQNERADIVDDRIAILTEFRDNFDSLSDDQARELLDKALKYEDDIAKLRRKYVREFRKVLSDRMVLRYMQIENKIDSIIDYDLSQLVPLAE